MIYLRFFFLAIWLAFCCVFFFFVVPFRWGDLNLDHEFAQFFGPVARWICGLKVEVENPGGFRPASPVIFVANHQGAIDVVTFSKVCGPKVVIIGKKEIVWVPFFGLFFKAAGNILIDRGRRRQAIAGLSKAVETLREKGASIWVFPEGTRNRTSEPLLPFKKGAFYMAIEAQVPVVPLACSPIKELVDWKARRLRPGTITLRALDPIPTAGMSVGDAEKLAEMARGKILEALPGLSVRLRP